jgi:hypothetical protein
MQPNKNSDPLLEDSEDRPAGETSGNVPAAAGFVATPGTVKKKIMPVNESAVREALATSPPAKPPVDTTKIYNEPPHTPGPGSAPAAAPPPPAPSQNELSAAVEQSTAIHVSSVVPGLQLYAIVMIILSGLNILAYINRLTDLYGPHTISLMSVILNGLPMACALYLLRGKQPVVIKALLIVIGITYAYLFVAYGVLITRIHSAASGIFIFSTLVCGALVYWTWRIFSNIEQLDESGKEK